MPASGEVDIAVIGAGAAGLSAGRRLLAEPGLGVLVLEAGDRVGGRAHTRFMPAIDASLDLGCAWLHGAERNPWTGIAEGLGLTVDRTPAPWGTQYRDLGFSPAEQAACKRASDAFYARVAEAARSGEDRPLSSLLDPRGRWNGRLDAVSTYVSGAELDGLSLHDSEAYTVAGSDWRVREGFGRTIAAYGAEAPVALSTPVTDVDHSGPDWIGLKTSQGTIRARAVVVTVSTNVLAREAIRFTPALPDKVSAAASLPLGLADKVYLAVDAAADLPADGHLVGDPRAARTGAYHLRPFGRPVIEGFYGGQLARDLEAAGPEAASAFAADELAGLLGSGIRAFLRPLVATAWEREPHILGSYAYARPGAAGSRAILAAPVDRRLFFAGEATSAHAFTTAQGAHETGIAAAEAALAALRPAATKARA